MGRLRLAASHSGAIVVKAEAPLHKRLKKPGKCITSAVPLEARCFINQGNNADTGAGLPGELKAGFESKVQGGPLG